MTLHFYADLLPGWKYLNSHHEAVKLSPQPNPRFRPRSVVFSVASRSAAGQSMIERSHSAIKRTKILNVRSGPANKKQIDNTERV